MKKILAVLLASAFCAVAAGPPGIKVSELPAGTNANGQDLVLIVQNPSSAPTTKKLTVAEFLSGQTFSNSTMFNVNLYNPLFAGLDLTNLIVTVAGQGSNSIANSFGSGTNTALYAPTVFSNNILLVHGITSTPYSTLVAAQSAATNGDLIRVTGGRFGAKDLGKHGVNWYFDPGVSLFYNGDFSGGSGTDSGAIFTDNPGSTWLGGFANASNSMSYSIKGHVTATNLTGSFGKWAGTQSRISVEADMLTSANPTNSTELIVFLSDYYAYPETAAAANASLNVKARLIGGLLTFCEHATEYEVDTYTNVTFVFDRDSNAERPNVIKIKGREAIDCWGNSGRPFNSLVVFDIPKYTAGKPWQFAGGGPTFDSIFSMQNGTVQFNNMVMVANTNIGAKLFDMYTGTVYAQADYTNAGRLVFNNCVVIGNAAWQTNLIVWSKASNFTNDPSFFINGSLSYVNCTATNLPPQCGPGVLVQNPQLTNYFGGRGGAIVQPATMAFSAASLTLPVVVVTNMLIAGPITNSGTKTDYKSTYVTNHFSLGSQGGLFEIHDATGPISYWLDPDEITGGNIMVIRSSQAGHNGERGVDFGPINIGSDLGDIVGIRTNIARNLVATNAIHGNGIGVSNVTAWRLLSGIAITNTTLRGSTTTGGFTNAATIIYNTGGIVTNVWLNAITPTLQVVVSNNLGGASDGQAITFKDTDEINGGNIMRIVTSQGSPSSAMQVEVGATAIRSTDGQITIGGPIINSGGTAPTTNFQILVPGAGGFVTNTLYITNGLIMRRSSP